MTVKAASTKKRYRVGHWTKRNYCEQCEQHTWWNCREVNGTEEHICAKCRLRREYRTT